MFFSFSEILETLCDVWQECMDRLKLASGERIALEGKC